MDAFRDIPLKSTSQAGRRGSSRDETSVRVLLAMRTSSMSCVRAILTLVLVIGCRAIANPDARGTAR